MRLVVVAAITLACGRPSPPLATPTPLTTSEPTESVVVEIAPPGDYPTDDDGLFMVLDIPSRTCTYGEGGLLPDPDCTPGDTNAQITADNIKENICNSQWSTRSVRPPTSYTNRVKRMTMRWYGVQDQDPAQYELDHLIPLALGGDPRDVKNLWPQPRQPQPGFPDKDRVERFLQIQVCAGNIGLDDAREAIAHDFRTYLTEAGKVQLPFDFDPQGEP